MYRTKLVPVVVALLLTLSGCGALGGGDSTPESSDAAQHVQEQSIEAMESVDSYRMTMEMSVEGNGQSMAIDMDGLIDRSARKMQMDMSVSGATGDQSLEMYVENQTAYINVGGMWQEQNMEDQNLWDQQDLLEQQQELLDESRVSLAENETIDGEPVRVIEVDPDEDALKEVVAQQQGTDFGGANFESVTYRHYVSEETHRLKKVEMDASIEVDGETADTTMTMTTSDYGTNETVEIPSEATSEA